ncbi:MAG: DUF4494 domain-containing protein [Bacteroidaceae bacterium]|nr:DUF4494 domain-containing protein [Bacteroidaceae bacterium]
MNNEWFECKVRYDKTMETGLLKKTTETYLVEALSFTEAERRFIEEMRPFISGEFVVTDIKRSRLAEIFESIDSAADRWFRAKVSFITLDEKTGAEKRTSQNILVQATDFRDAVNGLDKGMEGTLGDWVIASMTETAIMDVYHYKQASEKPEFEQ